jgi:hypothetical protein
VNFDDIIARLQVLLPNAEIYESIACDERVTLHLARKDAERLLNDIQRGRRA